ncbi:MAG: nitrilase family protein [Saprospiraceae bacterium]|nr:nitrilase family protein [Saprospiraceae bacterium]
MTQKLKVATAQFEHKSGDKNYNLSVIGELTGKAVQDGAKLIAFHECSITGYTFARYLSRPEMLDLAEEIPNGPSVKALQEIAMENDAVVFAGLFEKDQQGDLYKAYVGVGPEGLVAKYRKIHPFINPHVLPGNQYCVVDLYGWKIGILICYDNNIIENVRATKLLGAEVIIMPHVTMCTPSTRPGAGFVDPKLWENRENDPTSLRLEFDGMKGRDWLMKWLPARAYDNAIYVIFSNPIGMDDDQLKNGCSMIIDPFGDVISECRMLGDGYTTAILTRENLTLAGGHRYTMARKPELYADILSQQNTSTQKVSWLHSKDK